MLRWGARAVRSAVVAVVVSLLVVSLPASGSTHQVGSPGFRSDPAGTIRTIGGGPRIAGSDALDVGQFARALAAHGDLLYVADTINGVVRALNLTTGTQTAVAGLGSFGYGGDGGPATLAQIDNEPATGLAVDPSTGDLYIAGSGNHRVRRVAADADGKVDGTAGEIISTVAGTGQAGYAGDGGPATAALLHRPTGLAFDSTGNLYIAEWENSVVRRVEADSDGKVDGTAGEIITTIAGQGKGGFGGDGGPATDAWLNIPLEVEVDAHDNVYVVDTFAHKIRRIDADTGIISTVAGSGVGGFLDGVPAAVAAFNLPMGLTIAANGDLLIADAYNNRIRRVDATTQLVTTVAGTGAPAFAGDGLDARLASFYLPTGVALVTETAGTVMYVADFANFRVRRIGLDGVVHTFAGNGTLALAGDGELGHDAQMNGVFDVDVDPAGNVYVADAGNSAIRLIDADGVVHTVAGTGRPGYNGDGIAATDAWLQHPFGVAVAPDGAVWIADSFNHRVRRVDPGADGIVDGDADEVITTEAGTNVFGFAGDGGLAKVSAMTGPVGIDVDSFGRVYVADHSNNRVRMIWNGFIYTIAGNGLLETSGDGGPAHFAGVHHPADVAVDESNPGAPALLISEQGGHRIRKMSLGDDRIISTVAGSGSPLTETVCFDPRLEAIDVTGPVGDGGPAVSATLTCPTGVAVDGAGNVYIGDFQTSRLRRVDASSGLISTVAGTGQWGLTGDGGSATSANIYGNTGLVVDHLGNIIFADHGNNRVRRVALGATPRPRWLTQP